MALRQDAVRLLIADDVGVGKTIEALLIIRELLERRKIKRFAVVCLPHLCEQWQDEIRSKLDIEAVIIRSNTQARLDRRIQGDASVYDYYPFQIVSIDFIKSDVRRDVFIEQCPELVIVDETHTCARPTGASAAQQQRYHLVSRIAAKPGQQLVMLTATPHSGKPEEFQSLLGLLKPEFESLDLPNSSQMERRTLAQHFIQRKRSDVEKWMGEETPFPKRDTFEWSYDLSRDYSGLFSDLIDFARKMVLPDRSSRRRRRVQYWTALALLRGIMSSPDAGIKMLNARRDKLNSAAQESDLVEPFEDLDVSVDNPVRDLDYGFESDNAPTHVVEQSEWTDNERRQLRQFAERLEVLANIQDDQKLFAAAILLEEWIEKGFRPVVFCRYIETAKYLGKHLEPALRRKYPKLDLRAGSQGLPFVRS
jgi:SNF2 family DNA or RNA helicase